MKIGLIDVDGHNFPIPSALVIYRGPEENIRKAKTNIQQITIGELLNGID